MESRHNIRETQGSYICRVNIPEDREYSVICTETSRSWAIKVTAKCKAEKQKTENNKVLRVIKSNKEDFKRLIGIFEYDDLEVDQITAFMANDVLALVVPKTDPSQTLESYKHNMGADWYWMEFPQSYIFHMKVPGYTRDELTVTVHEGTSLIIKAHSKHDVMNICTEFIDGIAKTGNSHFCAENNEYTVVLRKYAPPSQPKISIDIPINCNL